MIFLHREKGYDMSLKINEQIVALRKQKGITQGELAEVIGVSNQSVSKWESGQCCPDIQLLPDLADYFGVSVDELMGLEPPKTESQVQIAPSISQNINDSLLYEAKELLGTNMLISTSVLQRKMGVGYQTAKALIEKLQEQGEVVEIRPGFYQRQRSKQDYLKSLVKSITEKEEEDMLNVVLALHAAWFAKMQQKENSAISEDGAMDAVIGGKWGYSAFCEPDITTVMRGQSVFYSKNRALDFHADRIGNLSILLKTLSDRKNLTVMAAIYELTVCTEDTYVGIDEIICQCKLMVEDVQTSLENGLFPYLLEKDYKYRIKGECMAILPILSILCF